MAQEATVTSSTLEEQSSDEASALQHGAYPFFGTHLLASLVNCDPIALNDDEGLLAAMERAVVASRATLLSIAQHKFPNGAITAVVVLAESHASIHTYPEHSSCFIDIFTCGDTCDPQSYERSLREYLRPAEVVTKLVHRGSDMADIT